MTELAEKVSYIESKQQIKGQLTRETIPTLNRNVFKSILKNNDCKLDLSLLSKTDTAGLAWLLTLIEYANQNKVTLSFQHLPEDLLKLARLSGVDGFLLVD